MNRVNSLHIDRKLWLGLALVLIAGVMWFAPGSRECSASAASDVNQTDYCFRLDLTVENLAGGAGDLTNYPVVFSVPALNMINNGQMDSRFWDIRPTQGGFGAEVDLLAQDCACDASKWWLIVPSLPDETTRTYRVYIGNNEQKRNQGIAFTGNEVVQAASDAVFSITNNLQVDVEVEVTSSAVQTASLFERWTTPNAGYKLDLVNVASTLTLRAYANDSTCQITWDSAWTDSNVLFSYRFAFAAGNDLFIDANGVNVVACDTDEPSIFSAGGTEFNIGANLDSAIVRQVQVLNAGTIAVNYGFDARAVSESTAADPTFTGTIQDYGPNDKDLTYTFTRDQSGLNTTVGALALTSAGSTADYTPTGIDLLGATFFNDPFAAANENSNALGYELFDAVISGINAPRPMVWSMFLGGIGLFLAALAFWWTRSAPIALFSAALPLVWGSINGFMPLWWLVLWGLLILTAYGAQQWGEQS